MDEIHRLPRAVEETFYPAMEDRQLPITVGQGAGARVVTLDLPPFTLIGATTRAGRLTTPLRDRFGIQHRLDPYGTVELAAIVQRSARSSRSSIDGGGAEAIAERSRGTPRVANRLLKRVRDYAEVRGGGVIDAAAADAALELLEVDHDGLDRLDREILDAICVKFGGGPVGLSTLAVAVGEEPTRSRTSTSPTCCSAASSSAPRAAAWRRCRPSRTSGSRRRRTRRSSRAAAAAGYAASVVAVSCDQSSASR